MRSPAASCTQGMLSAPKLLDERPLGQWREDVVRRHREERVGEHQQGDRSFTPARIRQPIDDPLSKRFHRP